MASPGCPVPPLCPASLHLCLSCHWVIPLLQLRVFSHALLDAGFKSGFVGPWEVVSIAKSVSSSVSERPCLQMGWRVIEQDAHMGLWLPHQHVYTHTHIYATPAYTHTHICATPTCTPTDTCLCQCTCNESGFMISDGNCAGQGQFLHPVNMIEKLGFALMTLLSVASLSQVVSALLLNKPLFPSLPPLCPTNIHYTLWRT